MGADLFITYTDYPHAADGKDIPTAHKEQILAETLGRIKQLEDQEVIDLIDEYDPSVLEDFDAQYHKDHGEEEPPQAALAARARERLLEAAEAVIDAGDDSREVTFLTFDGVPKMFTGGMSWGDDPTEVYSDVNLVSLSGIFAAPFTLKKQP